MNFKVTVPLFVAAAALRASAVKVVGDANTTTVVTPTSTIITAKQNATLTVTEPGEIEILLVGGGGGAGGSAERTDGYTTGDSRGGGGGGGGVIHKQSFNVTTGEYSIIVGSGGAVNRSHDSIAVATGGSTTGFGLTALGGGPGGCVNPTAYYDATALVGASGGGGSKNSNGRSYPGGSALASAENENRGSKGSNADSYQNGGGGGGAMGAGSSVSGGNGYPCDISGETVYYGGGGGGGRRSTNTATPGLGGGKANYGGGGTAQIVWNGAPEAGGSGIVIVRFTRTEQKTASDFKVGGYDAKGNLDDDYRYLVITNDTTLHVTGSASFDMLLVGGGGGAGGNNTNRPDHRGGGGGGGGVIHVRNFPVTTGDYAITVGPGGAVNTGAAGTTVNGGNTVAFGFTAFGGGPGAPASGYGATIGNIGASGGGGSTDGGTTEGKGIIYGGTAKASATNYNFGHAGADAYVNGTVGAQYNGGGGGGSGGAAVGGVGGDGYACDITGTTVYYGGGGAGGKRYGGGTAAKPGLGGGSNSYGGGGSGQYTNNDAADGQNAAPQSGGHGIVIIRYKKPLRGAVISVQ